jgi:hypothetical protein
MAAGPPGGVLLGNNSYKFKKYKDTFSGVDGTGWLCDRFRVTRATAVDLVWTRQRAARAVSSHLNLQGQHMLEGGFVDCVVPGSKFSDSGLLYRFTDKVLSSERKPGHTHLHVVFPDGVERRFEMDTTQTVRTCVER